MTETASGWEFPIGGTGFTGSLGLELTTFLRKVRVFRFGIILEQTARVA